jgi:4-hydroxymandelate oxidase
VSPLCVEDYQRLAREKLSPDVWDYIEGGGGAELTLRANRRAFEHIRLRPRVMVDVSTCVSRTDLLGASLAAPLGVAPTAYHRLAHADGEVGTALGAGAAGVLYVVAMFASRTLEEIAAAASGPLWLQLYWLHRRDVLADLVHRATATGYRAIVLTADAPRIGRRLRDLRNGFAVDPDIRAVNVAPDVMAATHRRRTGESAIAVHASREFDASLTWSDLAWLRGLTDLPIVVKGVLAGDDAIRAVESGVDGIIVSNHGGRQLDGVLASLAALADVVDAVAGRCPVLFDGGVRGGTDVFAALALGASAVLLGRPVLWALAHDGAAGVGELFGLVRDELTHTMALAGRPSLKQIDRSAVIVDGGW